jgi:hypothetical protein
LLVEEGLPEVEPVVGVSAEEELDAGSVVPEPVLTVEGRAGEVIEVVTDTLIDCPDAVVVRGVKVGSVDGSGI